MLHLIFKMPADGALLHRIGTDHVVVLMDTAVLKVLRSGSYAPALLNLMARARCCVLSEHLKLYGLATSLLVQGIEVIDFQGLVDLTVANTPIQSWN